MFDIIKAGKQIAYLRKEKGYTQEELANKMGVSPQAVSKWENGHTMPETILLPTLSEVLDCSIDYILLSRGFPAKKKNENFEITLMPYKSVGKYTGSVWPHSMAYPSLFTALKLFIGLETRLNNMNRQINDDREYILQSVLLTQAFGYSYLPDELVRDCFLIYGLDFKRCKKNDFTTDEFINLAIDNIKSGYPVIVAPNEYSEIILATGFRAEGKMLKGLSFLEGDDRKNASFDFTKLNKYPNWFDHNVDLIVIKPSQYRLSLHNACINAFKTGYSLLSNTKHLYDKPLKGYGIIIYDNWISLLENGNEQKIEKLDNLFPDIFIHYENKLRLSEFFEQFVYEMIDIDKTSVSAVIDGYNKICEYAKEIIAIYNNEKHADKSVCDKRLAIISLLKDSRECENSLLVDYMRVINQYVN